MKKLALASLVAAATIAAPAQAVTVMAEDGWTLGVSGQVNQFLVYTDDKTPGGQETVEVRDGLLPVFLNFDMSSPEMNGLTMAAHISISPSTNTTSQEHGTFEQREAYATVSGDFGTVLMGKALGLYGTNAIVSEQTLYGVGWGTRGNGTTTLGGIGIGYDYADWRSQIRYTSPDMNGFQAAFAIVDGQGPATDLGFGPVGPLAILAATDGVPAHMDTDELRYEAALSYAGAFDGGSFKLWVEGAWQDRSGIVGHGVTNLAEDAQYWAVGGTLAVSGFSFAAQYSDAEDSSVTIDANTNTVTGSTAEEWSNWFVQAGYTFGGTTLVSVSYSELEDDNAVGDDTTDRTTVGIYHDVNSNLKLVAEYTHVEFDNDDVFEQDIFSLGGFVFF
jgi:predicted porin